LSKREKRGRDGQAPLIQRRCVSRRGGAGLVRYEGKKKSTTSCATKGGRFEGGAAVGGKGKAKKAISNL